MIKQYRFAGVEIAIDIPDNKMYTDEYRLAPFAIDDANDPQVCIFQLVEALDEREGMLIVERADYQIYEHGGNRIRYVGSVQSGQEGAYIRTVTKDKMHHIQLLEEMFPNTIGTKTVLNALDIQHLIAEEGGFILHCSFIEINGRAILFTAPSETGKSTQAELWKQYRNANIINGDRAVVRIVNRDILAEGIPFAGSSKYCKNASVPLDAIVYLSQASQTSIKKMTGAEAFARIWEGISVNHWDKSDVEMIAAILEKVIKDVPMYSLACTPDESAVEVLEQALKERFG